MTCKAFLLRLAVLVLTVAAVAPAAAQSAEGPRLQVQQDPGGAQGIALSADGKTALLATRTGRIDLWALPSGKLIRSFVADSTGINFVGYAKDGKSAVVMTVDEIERWDLQTGARKAVLALDHPGRLMALSPDGETAAILETDLTIWNLRSGGLVRTLMEEAQRVDCLAFSPDGRRLLSAGSEEGTIQVWDVAGGQLLRSLSGHTKPVLSAVFSPDGKTIVSSSADLTIKKWDAERGTAVQTFSGAGITVFSADAKEAMCFSEDLRTMTLLNLATGEDLGKIDAAENGTFSTASFVPDGRTAVATWSSPSGQSDSEQLLDLESGKIIATLGVASRPLVISPDGRSALVESPSASRLHDVLSGETIRSFAGGASLSAFTPDGRSVILGSAEGVPVLWDVSSGQKVSSYEAARGASRARFLAMGRWILFEAVGDFAAMLVDASNGLVRKTWTNNEAPWAVSQDAGMTLSYGFPPVLSNGRELETSDAFTGPPIVFSPDGRTVVLQNRNGMALWDTASGKLVRDFTGAPMQGIPERSDGVNRVCFSPDGRLLAEEDGGQAVAEWLEQGAGQVRVWDVATGRLVRTLDNVCRTFLQFSADGRSLITYGGFDNRASCWDVSNGRLLFSFLAAGDSEWLAWTPEGFFAGTDWATHNLVHLVDGLDVYPVEKVYKALYRPDLVAAKAAGRDITTAARALNLRGLLVGRLP